MNHELTPKESFQQTDLALKHIEWAASKAAAAVIQVALAEMTMRQARTQGLEEACRSHYELLGARRFIDILLNLSEPESVATRRPTDNLLWQPLQHNPRPQPPPSSPPQTRRSSRTPRAK